MRKLIVSEFVTLDGVMQAPGGKDEDRDGGFEHGGWTLPYWHDDIGRSFGALMAETDAFLLGRRTYVTHAEAFEPLPAGDLFGDMMNAQCRRPRGSCRSGARASFEIGSRDLSKEERSRRAARRPPREKPALTPGNAHDNFRPGV